MENEPSIYKLMISRRESTDAPCNLHPALTNTLTPLKGEVEVY